MVGGMLIGLSLWWGDANRIIIVVGGMLIGL